MSEDRVSVKGMAEVTLWLFVILLWMPTCTQVNRIQDTLDAIHADLKAAHPKAESGTIVP